MSVKHVPGRVCEDVVKDRCRVLTRALTSRRPPVARELHALAHHPECRSVCYVFITMSCSDARRSDSCLPGRVTTMEDRSVLLIRMNLRRSINSMDRWSHRRNSSTFVGWVRSGTSECVSQRLVREYALESQKMVIAPNPVRYSSASRTF